MPQRITTAIPCFFTEAICERSPTYPPKPVLLAVDHLLGARSGRRSGAKSDIVQKSAERRDFLNDQRDSERHRMIRILATALLALSLTASGAFALSLGELVKTDGLWYEKFTDVPFTGEVDEGVYRGTIKNGNREGPWVMYYGEGRLWSKSEYKNGSREGPWVRYWYDGTLYKKGAYKNGKEEGPWLFYINGDKHERWSGTYRNGEKISD